MTFFAAFPFMYALVFLFGLFFVVLGVGIYGARLIPRKIRSKLTGPMGTKTPWRDGEDLLRYPRRLEDLENRLAHSHRDAQLQLTHLDERIDSLREKGGRDEIAVRYEEDVTLLDRRAKSMRRVLGLVWRTRAILQLRAHLAITARRRPDLGDLPGADVPVEHLNRAVADYQRAAQLVRRFVDDIGSRKADMAETIPSPPVEADVTDALQSEIDAESHRIGRTYHELQERMDHLADTLDYLADRCRTRRVFEGSTTDMVAEAAGGEALMEQVNLALGELSELAGVGELHLADSTLDALAEDISQLEKAGLEAQAEADAAMEIAKLLEQFPIG